MHNKYKTFPICTYKLDRSFIKASSKFSCLLESGSEESRTKSRAADETLGHLDLTKRAQGMFGHNGRVSYKYDSDEKYSFN